MTNYERIKAMSVEELAILINDAEEQLQLPPCCEKHCEVWKSDGCCEHAYKAKCVAATLHWLQSEAEGTPTPEPKPIGWKGALFRTFLGEETK